jgi:general L-amino acid transport system substrate-binding protein
VSLRISHRPLNHLALAVALAICARPGAAIQVESHLDRIRQRGVLVCGVSTGVLGFAQVDGQGRYSGLDVDICRAVATAILAAPEKVRFADAGTVEGFLRSTEIDVVSRRLTWSLQREGLGLLFGPVTFYDGQGFMVPRAAQIRTTSQLANGRICLVPGTVTEFNLNAYVQARRITITKVLLRSLEQAEGEFSAKRCDALTADVSELGSVRSRMANRDAFEILPELISKEPLAPIVRRGDDRFFSILRWTIFAMIAAEELGVTSQNVAAKARSGDVDVKRLLGAVPGNGRSLGLAENWASRVIEAVGNYGEVFERNLGMQSPIRLERRLNGLWTDGGLMYAPPLRQ